MEDDAPAIGDILNRTCRAEYGLIVSVIARVLEDVEAAEDVVQGALERAVRLWPERGVPSNPGAWLTTVARRMAIDRLRKARRDDRLTEELRSDARGGMQGAEDPYALLARWPDERLQLVAACCHPALSARDRAALTLREVVGLRVAEIAHAFLTSESAMTGRLTRARRRLRERVGAYERLDAEEIHSRLPDVLRVLYLIFAQGYHAAESDQLLRGELCEEAIRLARLLVDLTDRARIVDRECVSLLALMLLLHARAQTRQNAEGLPVLLPDQDRSCWDASLIAEGLSLLERAGSLEHAGRYQLQAAVQAIHALASDPTDTDWRAIDRLYQQLYRLQPAPVVAVNGVVAMGMWRGPAAALAALDALERVNGEPLARYPWLYIARAHFAEKAGDGAAARVALERARALSSNRAERAFLTRRVEGLCGLESDTSTAIS
jgi:RNA polymerase sigma-70 factor (ECF subfamily)